MITAADPLAARDDPLYDGARRLVLGSGTPSVSLLIRSFGIGYAHAVRLVLAMESECLVPGELERYIAWLQQFPIEQFQLRTITTAAD